MLPACRLGVSVFRIMTGSASPSTSRRLGAHPPVAARLGSLRSFLRCASCRFAALYFVPFFAGVVQAGRGTVGRALLGAVFWLAYSISIEVTNRLTDRVEDEVNRPERTQFCIDVGWRSLQRVEIAGWCVVLAIDCLWLWLNPSVVLAVLLVAGLAVGIGYSRGPRLARMRYVGLAVLNLVFGGVFLLGWAAGSSFSGRGELAWRHLAAFGPLAVIVGVFVVALAGIKDITDRGGDLAVGYRSHFVDILDRERTTLLRGLAGLPFLLVLAFALWRLLPLREVTLLMFAPLSALVLDAVSHAETARDRMVVRELFYAYWLVFSSAALLLFVPRVSLGLAVAGALLYWSIATRWLHWAQSVTIAEIRGLVRQAAGRERRPAANPVGSRT
jgi:4-hydroxybenzoate polyprenyltransferase